MWIILDQAFEIVANGEFTLFYRSAKQNSEINLRQRMPES